MIELMDTNSAAIAAEFVRARTRAGSPAMGMVMTLIVVVVPNVLLVRPDMPQQLQQDITRVIFENEQQLATVHPAANELDPATAGDVAFAPVCPGAKAFFDQAG